MTTGSNRYQGRSSSAYSPLMRPPEKNPSVARGLLAVALTLLCPPLGILYAWRAGVFPLVGRILLTAVGGLILAAIFVIGMPRETPQAASPTPHSPQRVTAVSGDESVTALSNMNVLLGLEEPAPAPPDMVAAMATPEPEPTVDPREAILDTVVYSVNSGAKYYHVAGECNGQTNRRQLTIREALEEGLTACGRCNPPTP